MGNTKENISGENNSVVKKRRPLWIRILKWTGISVFVIIGLIAVVLSVALWYLTPGKLTPIVNDAASSALEADVRAGRVELTFWSTFPRLEVKVDSLSVVSRRFGSLDADMRAVLPHDSDSLFKLCGLRGAINVVSLLGGKIELNDVELDRPWVNLVVVGDTVANFDIFPQSESDSESSGLPVIAINRFDIKGDMPVRYRSVYAATDTMRRDVDAIVTLSSVSVGGDTSPHYWISLSGDAKGGMAPAILASQPIGLDGTVEWDQKNPMRLKISDFGITFGAIDAVLDTEVDFSEEVTVERLLLRLNDFYVAKAVAMIPAGLMPEELASIDTDMKVNVSVSVDSPFAPLQLQLPVADVDLAVEAGYFNLDKIRLHRMELESESKIDIAALDRSVINLRRLAMQGPAMDFNISAVVTRVLSDPHVKGRFSGMLTLHRLPRRLLDRLPCRLAGVLRGDADVNMNLSDLSREKFHKMKANGVLTLDGFRMAMRDSTMEAYLNRGEFRLGTDSKIKIKEYSVDSLLTASLKVDTVAFRGDGVRIEGKTLSVGIGSRNVASSSDTAQINPIGSMVSAERLRLISDSDSVRIVLRETSVRGSVRRYQGGKRSPLLTLNVDARRMRYADRFNRAGISRFHTSMTLHPKGRRPMSAALKSRYDSIAALHPELSADSLLTLARKDARKHRRKHSGQELESGRENLDFGADRSLRAWLRRWQASGSVEAKRVRLITPYFPVRNTLSDLDLTFSTDSIVLRDTRLRSGKSDMVLNGSIRNISRAFTSRRGAPLELDFDVRSDTLDVNDIMAAAIRGSAFASRIQSNDTISSLSGLDIEADEERLQNMVESDIDSVAAGAFIVPSNITAGFRVEAGHVHYNDVWLCNLRGLLSMYDGAVNMQEFRASTEAGSFGLTALYSAPTRRDISFAAGMRIQKLNLRQLTHIMPQLDSILPMLGYMEGIVDADAALTTRLDSMMNFDLQTTNMALKLSGDSLVLLDSETFRTVSKWLLFKNKKRNMIDHMDVEVAVHDGYIDLYPFIFDMDRYKLGVRGSNDAAFNLDYHVAVLKSPMPFKFGVNIKGTPDKMKIRLGKARINEKTVASSRQLTDTVRVNLIKEIRTAFRRGMRSAGVKGLKLQRRERMRGAAGDMSGDMSGDTLSAADSLVFIQNGLIEAPKPDSIPSVTDKKNNKNRRK